MESMKNKALLDEIKTRLTGNKETDVSILHEELRKYQSQNNFQMAYQIQLLLFNYLSPEEKAKLNEGAASMIRDHKAKYEKAQELLNFGELEKAKKILIELFDIYEKAGKLDGANFYDFSEPIELFVYAINLKDIVVKKLPEPVVYYAYQIASIYLEQNDVDNAIVYLEKALLFNPICQYVLQELIERLVSVERYEDAYKYILRMLKYAYTKKQLAHAYKMLGIYFKQIKKYDIAVASLAVSNLYVEDLENKIKIKEIIDLVGPIRFSSSDELLSLFKRENINYGPSKEVIGVLKTYVQKAKERKDYKTLQYVLNIAVDLTDEEYFKKELESIK